MNLLEGVLINNKIKYKIEEIRIEKQVSYSKEKIYLIKQKRYSKEEYIQKPKEYIANTIAIELYLKNLKLI